MKKFDLGVSCILMSILQEIDIGAELIKQGFALSVDSISICASGAGSDAQSCELAAPRHACSAASPESWLMTQTGDL